MKDWEGADHRSAQAHYALYVQPESDGDDDDKVRIFRYAESGDDPNGASIEMSGLSFMILLTNAAKKSPRLREMLGKILSESRART